MGRNLGSLSADWSKRVPAASDGGILKLILVVGGLNSSCFAAWPATGVLYGSVKL